jgi:hypothetical protein
VPFAERLVELVASYAPVHIGLTALGIRRRGGYLSEKIIMLNYKDIPVKLKSISWLSQLVELGLCFTHQLSILKYDSDMRTVRVLPEEGCCSFRTVNFDTPIQNCLHICHRHSRL